MRRIRWFAALLVVVAASGLAAAGSRVFTEEFMRDRCAGFSTTGRNPYFILEPGYRLVLEGMEQREVVRVSIEVLQDLEQVDGVTTRVVEEVETKDGELAEISRNYFAICNRDNSVFYFGEDVDFYDGGVVTGHEGSWRSGVSGAMAGILMPGTVLLGARHYQEIAPEVALDRAVVAGLGLELSTPAGRFSGCLKVVESTPLEPGSKGVKYYAPDVGLIKDEDIELVSYGSP